MATITVSTAAELRTAVRTAPQGSVIQLTQGEYGGPLVLDRPITLRGHGRQTVLWRRAGPVLYIRATNVILENFLVERTVQRGSLIVHAVHCTPIGMESMELTGEMLINLGELSPGSSLSLPLHIHTQGRADLSIAGLYGASLSPTVIDDSGTHTITLTLDGKALTKGEILLGELTIQEKAKGRADHHIWLSGNVLDAPLPDRSYLLAAKRTQLIPSASGLPLSALLLRACGGKPSVEEGEYGVIQREGNGYLSLYLPYDPPEAISVNKTSVLRGTRVLLREQDMVQVAGVSLTAQPMTTPAFEIRPTRIEFADFGANVPPPVALELRNFKQVWMGQLVPTVPWLMVSPSGNLRLSGVKPHQFHISLSAEALDLPNGVYDLPSGLLLRSAEATIGLDVHLKINRPEVALNIAAVEAGSIELGWPHAEPFDVVIENLGRGAWSGELRSNVHWLEVLTPMPLSGQAWSNTVVQLQVKQGDKKLKEGTLHAPQALTLVESGGKQTSIEATVNILPPRGHLEVHTPILDFGEVERGQPELPMVALVLHNSGGADLTCQLQLETNWVQLEHSSLTLASNTTSSVNVSLLDIPTDQPLDTPLLIDTISVIPSGDETAASQVTAQLTIVERAPHVAARAVNFPPFVLGDTPTDSVLTVQNMGPAIWRGTVRSNVSWLTVPDRVFTCEAGSSVEIYLGLNSRFVNDLGVGMHRVPDAITILNARTPLPITVQLDLRPISYELTIETPTLNFGQINGGSLELPNETLRIVNGNAQAWQGQLAIEVPWLTLEGNARQLPLNIPSMSMAELKVLLSEAARSLPAGVIANEQALLITGDNGKQQQRIPINAMLKMLEWGPVLTIQPSHLTLKLPPTTVSSVDPDVANPSGVKLSTTSFTVKNVGGKSWPLTISAEAWLEVRPTELTLAANESQTVSVTLQATADMLTGDYPRAVVIYGQGHEFEVSVAIQL